MIGLVSDRKRVRGPSSNCCDTEEASYTGPFALEAILEGLVDRVSLLDGFVEETVGCSNWIPFLGDEGCESRICLSQGRRFLRDYGFVHPVTLVRLE